MVVHCRDAHRALCRFAKILPTENCEIGSGALFYGWLEAKDIDWILHWFAGAITFPAKTNPQQQVDLVRW